MKRLAEDTLHRWLTARRRKPLVMRGARQVGKTTLVRQFAAAAGLALWRGEPGAPSLPRRGVREPRHRPHPARVGDARRDPAVPGGAVPGRGAGNAARPARPALPLRGPARPAGGGGGIAARVHARRPRILHAGGAHSVPAPGTADVPRVPASRRPGGGRVDRQPGSGRAAARRRAPAARTAAPRVPVGRRTARGGASVPRVGLPGGGDGRPPLDRLDVRGRLRQVRPANAARAPTTAVQARAAVGGAPRELPAPRSRRPAQPR